MNINRLNYTMQLKVKTKKKHGERHLTHKLLKIFSKNAQSRF